MPDPYRLMDAKEAVEILAHRRCDEDKCSSCDSLRDREWYAESAQPTDAELAEAIALLRAFVAEMEP